MAINQIGKVEGLGDIYQSIGALTTNISDFASVGIQHPYLASPNEVAQIRLADLSNDWSRISMAPFKVKGEKTVIYRVSPFMDLLMASVIVKAHKEGKYPELPDAVYDCVKQLALNQRGCEPEDRDSIILSQDGDFQLTSDMEETRFILRKFAKQYFNKFGHSSITLYNLPDEKSSKGNCFANYAWFDGPGLDSSLGLGGRVLGDDGRAFGVLRSGAEGGAEPQKNLGYSLTEIRNSSDEIVKTILEKTGFGGAVDIVKGPLTKGLLGKLRDRTN